MGNTEARVPVEPRPHSIYTSTQKGEVNVNLTLTHNTQKNTEREPAQSILNNNIINLENVNNVESILLEEKKEKIIGVRVDSETYSEYKKLDYYQKRFIQKAVRSLIRELLKKGVPRVREDVAVPINLSLSVDNKILLTETCKDIALKLEKYKKAVMCVKQTVSFSRHVDQKAVEQCIKDLNPYRD